MLAGNGKVLAKGPNGDTFCNTTNEGGWLPPPSDFQNEPPYDAYFGTSG